MQEQLLSLSPVNGRRGVEERVCMGGGGGGGGEASKKESAL